MSSTRSTKGPPRGGGRHQLQEQVPRRDVAATVPGTPTTANNSEDNVPPTPTKLYINSSYLPFQYRRNVSLLSTPSVPSPKLGEKRPIALGLGSAAGNLKVSHIVNSKKESVVNYKEKKKYVPGCKSKFQSEQSRDNNSGKACNKTATPCPGGDGLTSRMKMLTIYESPKSSEGGDGNGISTTGKVFLTLNKKANYIAALNRKAIFTIGLGSSITVSPRSNTNSNSEEITKVVQIVCRQFRNILGWKMSIHMSWKYLEERMKSWSEGSFKELTMEEIAGFLKVEPEQVEKFQFDAELEKMFNILRKNLCHFATPNFAKLLALQKLQEGQPEEASKYLSEQCGMYLQSEIVDKHLTYIRRNEETKPEDRDTDSDTGTTSPDAKKKNEIFKTTVFQEQVNHTLQFSDSCFEGENEFKAKSSFNPEWNIVQLTTSVSSENKFGYDVIAKRAVPQLLLSAFGFLPGQKGVRNEFTVMCREPVKEPGSLMRHGLIEAFQQLLDKNMMVSDDKLTISRKKYWEERARHNDNIEAIMSAMEDWIFPWTFLLPGRIKSASIQTTITKEVLSHPLLKKNISDSKKFLVYRLTENYNLLPLKLKSVMDTLLSSILEVLDDTNEGIQSLTKSIISVGSNIPLTEDRFPTILVLEQDIDILPWDWISCLRTTDVTRMPSLNLINSTNILTRFVGGGVGKERKIDPRQCTFLLNPDQSLPQVQSRLETYFKSRESWLPIIARSPTTEEMQSALESQHLFLYCGHGAGTNFYPEYAVQKLVCKAIPILMGCSSGQSHFSGPGLYAYSSVHAYLTAGCTSVVGFLWEITDTECDRFTVEFLQRWLPDPNAKMPKMPVFDSETEREHDRELVTAVRKSRQGPSQLLTQCAAVCYGIPVVRAS